MFRSITLLALAGSLLLPIATLAADGEVIVIEGNCATNQHVGADGKCTCNNSTHMMVDFECVPDPSKLFSPIGDILLDVCEFLGHCTGPGGGGGNGGTPPPEPEAEDGECLLENEAGDAKTCAEHWSDCASRAFQMTQACPGIAAGRKCLADIESPGVVFPDGSSPTCRVASKTGAVICDFPNPLTNRPFVGDIDQLIHRCIDDWIASGELTEEIQACEQEALDDMLECQFRVEGDCEEAGCDFVPPLATLQSTLPDDEPEHELFVQARVRTRGDTAIDGERFVRSGARGACYWHLTAVGTLPPEGSLYCKSREQWEEVGASQLLLADGTAYLADGTCGVATADGVATGPARYRWRIERAEDGALLGARVKSVGGHAEGSLEGLHPYSGDCRLSGKSVSERRVPAGLLEQLSR